MNALLMRQTRKHLGVAILLAGSRWANLIGNQGSWILSPQRGGRTKARGAVITRNGDQGRASETRLATDPEKAGRGLEEEEEAVAGGAGPAMVTEALQRSVKMEVQAQVARAAAAEEEE